MVQVERAREIAERHLASTLPQRWRHVQGVAKLAGEVAAMLGADQDVLVAAAWLHDVGYGPRVVDTGFHSLDGARYLRRVGVDERVVALVGYHSCALIEAEERDLGEDLTGEFEREKSPTADALTYCDMLTGPDGDPLPLQQRLEEIRSRYGPDHLVTRFIDRAEREMLGAVHRTEERLLSTGIGR